MTITLMGRVVKAKFVSKGIRDHYLRDGYLI